MKQVSLVRADACLMDLTAAISSLQQAQTAEKIQTSVARKVMDSQRQQGDAVLQLLQAATLPQPGDSLVAQSTGLGGQLDVYA